MNAFECILLSTAAVIALSAAASAAPALPVYSCPKVTKAPVIDGDLGDEAWQKAPEVTLVLSTNGQPAHWNTTARMCWDDENLYICFRSIDEDIFNDYTKTNSEVYREEVVEAFIAPGGDLAHYYELNVTPRNVLFQGIIYNPTGAGPDPNKTDMNGNFRGLKTAVCVNGTVDNRSDIDKEWTAEIAFPFSAMGRTTPHPGERWRINLFRIERKPGQVEFQAWSPTMMDPPAFHIPDRFGTIFFME